MIKNTDSTETSHARKPSWRCFFGRHEWSHSKPFERRFVWLDFRTMKSSKPFTEWYQESTCARCGKEKISQVDGIWASRYLEKFMDSELREEGI